MRDVKEFIKHLEENKAVIVVGNYYNSEEHLFNAPILKEQYTRKNWVREPEKTWEFYVEHLYNSLTQKDLDLNVEKIPHTKIIFQKNQNIYNENAMYLDGNIYKYDCACGESYDNIHVFNNGFNNKCKCGKILKPSLLLSNEKRSLMDIKKFEELIQNTNSLILIGIDFDDKDLMKVIKTYKDGDSENKVLATIVDDAEINDINSFCKSEFIVRGNIDESIDRLVRNIK